MFKNATGQNVSNYLSARRLRQSQKLLRDPSIPIRQVCFLCGYDDPRYFAKLFKKHIGMTPSEFRNLYAAGGYPTAEDTP